LEGQPTFIGANQFERCLERFRLALAIGDEPALAIGGSHLHGADAGAGRGARHLLQRLARDACQLVHAVEPVLIRKKRRLAVDVQPAEQADGGGAVDDLPVREVRTAALARRRDGRVAIPRQGDALALGEAEDLGQDERIAPGGEQDIGIDGVHRGAQCGDNTRLQRQR
jgi:hypothetical protein